MKDAAILDTVQPPVPATEHPLLAHIKETAFNRGGTSGGGVPGLKPFFDGKVPEEFQGFYTKDELEALSKLQGTPRDIEDRMRVKLTEHYLRLAKGSTALQNLVKARPDETDDLSGEADPSNQNRYSPLPGLLHKYEMILLYTAGTCSAHCRYCYRLDLFSKKTGKELTKIEDVEAYIKDYNSNVPASTFPIREALLSGGDPMVLPNKRLARFMIGLAESGVETIRIGTKELAFFPYRFDANFFAMLDLFHEAFPRVRIVFATHFTHPDEFLEKDENGNYIKTSPNFYLWQAPANAAVTELVKRHYFISLENQTPIIYQVNDKPEILHILQKELYHKGLSNHYFFQCREIEGHKTFAVPVEESWRIFTESQQGLSGVEKKARFAMSTEQGKMEVIGITHGQIIFRIMRSPGSGNTQGNIIIAKNNPDALWITGYMDRIISDDTGLFKKEAV